MAKLFSTASVMWIDLETSEDEYVCFNHWDAEEQWDERAVCISRDAWEALREPTVITVTIESGDSL